VLVILVRFADAGEEYYVLPLVAVADPAANSREPSSLKVLDAELGETIVFGNALENDEFLQFLLQTIQREGVIPGGRGELCGRRSNAFAPLYPPSDSLLKAKLLSGEQSNSSIVYGDRLILKFFRRIEEGVNPDLEVSAFLTERAHYRHVPALAGFLEYRTRQGKQNTQAILQAFVANEGDAWKYTLESLEDFYEAAESASRRGTRLSQDEIHQFIRETIGPYLKSVALLGQRTAELHLALASDRQDPAFAPEPFSVEFRESFATSLLRMSSDVLGLLREKISVLPTAWRSIAEAVMHREDEIANRFRATLSKPIKAARIRIHGDFHLGQVLYTGSDFVIIDFEGEPARPLTERRVKRSPLQDVAGMLRSFHYAAFARLLGAAGNELTDANRLARLSAWAESWNVQVADSFLAEYFKTSGAAPYLQPNPAERNKLLELHLLEKAIYELGYELNNRPDWVGLPLKGISRLLST
jgi:trehalose synthase-fused probable maltokinase